MIQELDHTWKDVNLKSEELAIYANSFFIYTIYFFIIGILFIIPDKSNEIKNTKIDITGTENNALKDNVFKFNIEFKLSIINI